MGTCVHGAECRHALVVGIQDRRAVGWQRLDQFALRRRDPVDGIEILDMRVADVGHHADLRAGDLRQRREFRRRDSSPFPSTATRA